ncbi:class Ib ribonucleoside-diphosphate reductase assembly flavoprotein NrdI [Lacticaseibacillus casei]|uniref:class Ib ribonucleoside-diphosphate reductase assembly flavoprotein NrdI n=1 Tax=Lacticaseibacillus casei TaxID=1582 RepID=UPI001BD00BE8|nr:class Ib ribonucleoside-diphosphate reductase assembly flavoprotein NrdI [Lacticaseibacillus casei]QVI38372.1 class Ib ribonucleoside-diphosphate reductase assembly flavoprotein NrdI [Lacticaseibacillus casei]
MTEPIRVLFISISGNTRAFAHRLADYAETQHQQNPDNPPIQLKEISEATQSDGETKPFFVMVPTYLDGGNGIDNGVKELMTNAMSDYLAEGENAEYCLGIIGSGNRNFNEQYCLTAKRYAKEFDAPFLADYELRGTPSDAQRIYTILTRVAANEAQH